MLPAPTRHIKLVDERNRPLVASVSLISTGTSPSVIAQLRSDSRGDLELPSIPDREPLSFVVSEPAHAPLAFAARVSQLPPTLVMRPGSTVAGRFIDQKKKPVAGVHISTEGWLGDGAAVVARKTTSDAEGVWKIEQLPQQKLVIAGQHEGFVPFRREIAVATSSEQLGTIVLEPGVDVTLLMVDDQTGRLVSGARVDAKLGRTATADAKGRAVLHDVSALSPFDLSARAEGFLPREASLAPPFRKENRIDLTRGFTVKGQFLTSAGQAIDSASVRVTSGSQSRDVPMAKGAFQLVLPPDVESSLEFRSPSTRDFSRAISGRRGGVQDLGTLHPPSGLEVKGHVVNAAGAPVGGASIWAPRPSSSGALVAWARGDILRTESDEKGEFTLTGLGSEPLLLRLDGAGFARAFRDLAPATGNDNVDLGELMMREGGVVKVLAPSRSEDMTARIALRADNEDIDTLDASVRDGIATFLHIPAGHVVVRVLRGRSIICQKEVEVEETRQPLEVDCSSDVLTVSGTVLVGQRPASGGTLIWSSPLPTTPVEGIILNHDTALGARQQQVFGGNADVSVRVGDDGRFQTDDLRAGDWRARWISLDGGATEPQAIVITPQTAASIILQFADGVIRGVVVDSEAHPVRHASVREVTSGGGFAMSGDDGVFAIAGLLPGIHRVRAELRDLASEVADVDLKPGRAADPVTLVVAHKSRSEVAVRLVANDGQPLPNGFVFLDSAGGIQVASTDASGTATISFPVELPVSLRCAAYANGAWVLGDWIGRDSLGDVVMLRMTEWGSMVISTEESGGAVSIQRADGWNLSMLLMRLGGRPMVTKGTPLRIEGLPPGEYSVSLSDFRQTVKIVRGEVASVLLKR